MFSKSFVSDKVKIQWKIFDVAKQKLPLEVADCDGYLISGSRYSANGTCAWINSLITLVKKIHTAKIPMAGLCFGHQILAIALRGKVEKAKQGWGIGHKKYNMKNRNSNFSLPGIERITVPVCHQDQITTLPKTAMCIASNKHCENFIVVFGEFTVGIQGHPEFNDSYIKALVEYKKTELSQIEYDTAILSQAQPKDSAILRKLILDFLFKKKLLSTFG